MRFAFVAVLLLAATAFAQEYVSVAAQQENTAPVTEAAPAAPAAEGSAADSSEPPPAAPAASNSSSSDNAGSKASGYSVAAPAYEPVPEAKETPPPPPSQEPAPIPFTPPPYEPVPIPGEASTAPAAPAETTAAPAAPAETTTAPPPPPEATTAPPPPPAVVSESAPIPFTPPPYEPVPIPSEATSKASVEAPQPSSPPPYEPAPVSGEAATKAIDEPPPQPNTPPPYEEVPAQREEVTPPPVVVPSGCASDVLFVLDATGSVRKDYQSQKDFVKKIVETMNIAPSEQQVGMVLFSSKERQKIAFDLGTHQDKTSVLQAIEDLPYFSGITAIGQALVLAKTALEKRRPNVKVYVIVVTDGFSYDQVDGPAADLRAVPGVIIFSAGVAQPVNEFELKQISGDESRVFIKEDSLQALVSAMACKIK